MQDSQPPSPDAADSARHGFLRRPEPRSLGDAARGRLILAGHLPLARGWLRGDPFAADPESDADTAALHGFGWLDDLAAVGTAAARTLAQTSVLGWVRRNAQVPPDPAAAGPEWRADVTGQRVLRWVFHGGTLLPGLDRTASTPVFASLHGQLAYLQHHAGSAAPGLPRLEALAGLAIAAMSLRGAEAQAAPALRALAEAAAPLAATGTLPDRNPEALLDAAALLVWTREVAEGNGTPLPSRITQALAVMAPVLRALRHADGALVRAHGGGWGTPGRLEHVLRAVRDPQGGMPPLAMGFARMARGRSTLIIDAAPPPAAPRAQASSLGMEFTHGGSPLIVACGSGAGFGDAWVRAARATACASTATVDGLGSSRFDGSLQDAGLIGPRTVWAGGCDAEGRVTPPDCGPEDGPEGAHLLAGHDGWRTSHGLSHLRELWLAPDGLSLRGEDSLAAVDQAGRDRLSRILGHESMVMALHFHLHPALDVAKTEGGTTLGLPDGTLWRFRHENCAEMQLAPSVHFDPARPEPLPAWQILLTAPLGGFARRIGWTLAREG